MKILPSPKLEIASLVARMKPSWHSFSFHAMRIPFPPPPAVALSIIGYPISFAIFTASSESLMMSSYPGTVFTPAFKAISLEVILSPIDSIAFESGPIKAMPCAFKYSQNFLFSDRNPYPGCTASAPLTLHASRIFSIIR